MKRYWVAVPAMLVLTLSACADGSTPPAATGAATTTAGPVAGDATERSMADLMFASMMVPHHEQAVEMSDIVLAVDGLDPQVTKLAEQIKGAQAPEIELMRGWLTAWGEVPASVEDMGPDGHHGDAHGDHGGGAMPGIMSAEDMERLSAADAEEAGRLFLEMMIEHHEGAISMAEDQLADGIYPPARELAEEIIDAQRAEIAHMQELLAG